MLLNKKKKINETFDIIPKVLTNEWKESRAIQFRVSKFSTDLIIIMILMSVVSARNIPHFFFIFLFLDTIWEIMFRYRGESQMFTFHISHHCIITPFEFHLKFSSDSMVKWRNNIFDGRFDFFYFFLYFPFYCHSIAHCLATLSVWIHSSIWIMNVTMLC